MITDDAADIQTFGGLMLRECGAEVDIARNGQEAIDLICNGKTYHVILMDVQMPGCTGVQATQEIRKLGYKGKMVAFTGHRIDGDSHYYRSAGFDDYVDKNEMALHIVEVVKTFL